MDCNQKWFKIFKPIKKPRIRIICFPWAGGGASIYREWPKSIPDFIELLSLQLPGREDRIKEARVKNIFNLISLFHPELSAKLFMPFCLWGHSMGALIAYEYACFLKKNFNIEPIRLFISGRSTPNCHRRGKDLSRLDDTALIEELINIGGIPKIFLGEAQILDILVKNIRADLLMVDKYKPNEREKLSCPITVFAGEEDKACKAEDIYKWQDYTSGDFTSHLFHGGHFYFKNQTKKIVNKIVDYLI